MLPIRGNSQNPTTLVVGVCQNQVGTTCIIKCAKLVDNRCWCLVSCCNEFLQDDERRRLLDKWIETEGLKSVHPDVIKLMKIKEEK